MGQRRNHLKDSAPVPRARWQWPDRLHERWEYQSWTAHEADTAEDSENIATFAAWSDVASALAGEKTPVPRASVAERLASEIAISQCLSTDHLPAMPHSVASGVTGDIAFAHQLKCLAQSEPMPALQRQVAASVIEDIALSRTLHTQIPTMPHSIAAELSRHIATEARAGMPLPTTVLSRPAPHAHLPPEELRRAAQYAPATLVGSLVGALLLLTVTTAWPSLSAGTRVLASFLAQLPPTFLPGIVVLLATSGFIATHPEQRWQRAGAAAFTLAAVLTLPPLYSIGSGFGIVLGQDITVSGTQTGPLVSIAGDIVLEEGSRVQGDVLSLLGDVRRAADSQVSGEMAALLGQIQTGPVDSSQPVQLDSGQIEPVAQGTGAGAAASANAGDTHVGNGNVQVAGLLQDIQLASANAVRPLLGWLGGAAWGWLFWLLTSTLTLGLFISGAADKLAARQASCPLPTLASGTLALLGLLGAATLLGLSGWLAPALGLALMLTLLTALGLSVSAFDGGRLLARRLHAQLPDRVGVVLALLGLAAVLAYPAVTLAIIVVAAPWGVGTLAISGRQRVSRARQNAAQN